MLLKNILQYALANSRYQMSNYSGVHIGSTIPVPIADRFSRSKLRGERL